MIGGTVGLVQFDLKKCINHAVIFDNLFFDKVNHKKLIHKLYGYGVRGKTLYWLRDFLNGRSCTDCGFGAESVLGNTSNTGCPAGIYPQTSSVAGLHKWHSWKGKVPSEAVCRWHEGYLTITKPCRWSSTSGKFQYPLGVGGPIWIWTYSGKCQV